MPYPTLPSTSPPALSRDPDPALRLRPSVAAGTLAVAALTGLAVWALAVPVGGFDLVVAGRTVGPGAVVLAGLVGGTAAWLLLVVLVRTRRGRVRWTVCALAVLLLSLVMPVLAGAAGVVLAVLELMHLLVGGVLIFGLRRSAVPRTAGERTVDVEVS